MEDIFGTLSIYTFVTLPDGREKRASLASIECRYNDRKNKFLEFKQANPNLADELHLGARFSFSEWVCLY